MLDSLSISNFRLFKKLLIPRLGRVNLFSGKNGTGKSSILEAVMIYASNANFKILDSLVKARNEDVKGLNSVYVHNYFRFRHLFNGRNPAAIEENPVLICVDENSRIVPRSFVIQDTDWTIKIGNKDGSSVTVPHKYVSINKNHPDSAAELWDEINLLPIEDDVIEALQIIHPGVKRIGFVDFTENNRTERVPVVVLKDMAERIPLKSLGEGVVHLLHIVLALVNAKQGFFLLDEAENGLHWSVQEKLWQIIFQLANKLDIQVLATTHSKDCIAAFQAAWAERAEEEGGFYRLDPDPEWGAKCTPYSLRTLSNALKNHVEMR
ncbi:MAG: AAA family ATPase [Magnetococcales bacterium]|nr:AAA family ATPase [Magnetococcales bacterium]